VLEKQSVTCFLILPDEISDGQIDNVTVTKKYQKFLKVAPGSQRLNPSAEWRTSILRQVLKHLFGVVQPGLETYH